MSLQPEELTDEQLEQLMALGIIPDQQSSLDKQIATAEQLRYRNKPEMRQAGRISMAANPLEFLVAGVQGHQAGKQLDELRKKSDDLLQQQVQGRKLFYQALRNRSSQPPALGPMPSQEEYL